MQLAYHITWPWLEGKPSHCCFAAFLFAKEQYWHTYHAPIILGMISHIGTSTWSSAVNCIMKRVKKYGEGMSSKAGLPLEWSGYVSLVCMLHKIIDGGRTAVLLLVLAAVTLQ